MEPTRGRAVQRRTVAVLSGSQVLGGVGMAGGVTAGGLLVAEVSGSDAMAGLSQTAVVLGGALAAIPLARLSLAHGRRLGLAAGYATGAAGAALVVLSAAAGLVLPLIAGMALFGAAVASGLQARYAATDLASPRHVSRDLSIVVWMTAVGAVLGPNLAGPAGTTAAAVGLPGLTGMFLWSGAAFVIAAVGLVLLLRPDPLLLARATRSASAPGSQPEQAPGRPGTREAWDAVMRSPRASLALAALATVHTAMVALMVMTPLHLGEHGASLTIVGLVISGHVAGMYVLSPLVGALADRIGQVPVIVLGCALMAASAVLAAAVPATSTPGVGVALFLLGVGWSCGVVAGSALLTASVPESARPPAQGLSDLVMGLSAATAGALAGVVFGVWSYAVLGALVALLVVPVAVGSRRHLGVRVPAQ